MQKNEQKFIIKIPRQRQNMDYHVMYIHAALTFQAGMQPPLSVGF